MTKINELGVRSSTNPNSYIRKITIAPAGAINSRSQNTIDKTRPVKETRNRYGDLKYDAGSLTNDIFTVERSLKSTVEVLINDLEDTKTNQTTWVKSENSRKDLVLKVFQSTNKELTDFLVETRAFDRPDFKVPDQYNHLIDYQVQIISLEPEADEEVKVNSKPVLASNGNRVVSIQKVVEFSIPREPEHLTYFAFTQQGEQVSRAILNSHSPIIIERVVESASLVDQSFIFTDSSGDVWTGPVHYQPNTGWMQGAFHVDIPHEALTRSQVTNSKIVDLRVLEEVSQLQIDIAPDPSAKIESNSYTTELYLTRDQAGNSLLTFGFDHFNYMVENSKYGRLFQVASRDLREYLLQNSKILNMSVVRREVRPSKGESRLQSSDIVLEDIQAPSQVIVSSREQNGTLNSITRYNIPGEDSNKYIEVPTDKEVSDRYQLFGRIEEIFVENTSNFRTFAVMDANIASITQGNYQYSIELQIQDIVGNFLAQKNDELKRAINVLENYLSIARKPENYNAKMGTYTQSFVEKMGSRSSTNTVLPWVSSIVKYIEVLEIITDIQPEQKTRLSRALYGLISPFVGTNDGIQTTLELMRALDIELGNLLSPNKERHFDASGAPKSAVSQGAASRLLTSTIDFSEVFDTNILKGSGFDYFDQPPAPKGREPRLTNGILKITTDKYRERINKENQRYEGNLYDVDQISTEFPFISVEAAEALILDNTKFSYVAPTSVDLLENRIPLQAQNKDSLDYTTATSIIQNVINDPASKSFTVVSTAINSLINNLGGGVTQQRLADLNNIQEKNASFQDFGATSVGTNKGDTSTRIRRRARIRAQRDATTDSEEFLGRTNKFSRESSPRQADLTELEAREINLGGSAVLERLARRNTTTTNKQTTLSAPAPADISYDLTKNNNFISTRVIESNQGDKSVETLKNLPQQIKLLTLNKDRVYNDAAAKASSGDDANTDGFIYNFGMIRQVEYLSGYEGGYGNSPMWKLLDNSVLENLGTSILCRIRQYNDPKTNIGSFEFTNSLPVYNEYFIITTQRQAAPQKQPPQNFISTYEVESGFLTLDSRSIYSGFESELALEVTRHSLMDLQTGNNIEYFLTETPGAPTNSLTEVSGIGGKRARRDQAQQVTQAQITREPRRRRTQVRTRARTTRGGNY
jgi:hypothetical protein